MRRLLFALFALAASLTSQSQPISFSATDGWSLVSNQMPSDPQPYFFAFVEKSKGYALGMKDGIKQSGFKTMTLKSQVTAQQNRDLAWKLVKGDGTNIINLSNPDYFMQTEWNASWNWRCSDNGGGDPSWGWLNINEADNGFVLQQNKYQSYLGPWNVSIVTDDEFAGNRTQDEAPRFDIYHISRGDYVAACCNLISASESSPIDISFVIDNADATFRNMNGWVQEFTNPRSNGYTFQTQNNGELANVSNQFFFESWQWSGNLSDRQMYQTINGLPAGNCRLSVSTDCTYAGAYLFAGDEQVALNQNTDGVASINFHLDGETPLKLGVKLNNYQNGWIKFDCFKLQFVGAEAGAIRQALLSLIDEANSIYVAGKTGSEEFLQAIQDATAIANNSRSTATQLQDAMTALQQAITNFQLRSATTSAPLDFCSWIQNPSFEDNFNHWSQEGMQLQSNNEFTTKAGNTYCEKWTPSTGTLAPAHVSQTVANTPMGVYQLKVAAQHINQGTTNLTCTGANLTANIDLLSVNRSNNYTLTFTNIEDSIDLGFVIKNATGNWAACDNFRLYYCGWNADAFNTQMQKYINAAKKLYTERMNSDVLNNIKNLVSAAETHLAARDTANYHVVSRPMRLAMQTAQLSIDAYAALKTAIDAANAKCSSNLSGADDYRAAIQRAQNLYDSDASNEALYAMIPVLERAGLLYDTAHGSGPVPTITTDQRTARGAVRIFGRFTYNLNGASLKARGFAYATHRQPTIADGMSTREFDKNGIIYVIEGVQPGSCYYIRPFVITTGNQVAYGDELRVYTIPKGTMTWSYDNGGSAEENARINAAIRYGMDTWNEMMSTTGFHLSAHYGSQTPTADCSYGGWMRIGPNASYQRTGTIMHEAAHGVGVGTQSNWSWLMSGGNWIGDRANAVVQFWDNDPAAFMKGDGMHMWPYGVNGAHEDDGSDQLYYGNSLIIQAMGEDGLSPTNGIFAQPANTFVQQDETIYYITSEDTSKGSMTAFLTFDGAKANTTNSGLPFGGSVDDDAPLVWKTVSNRSELTNGLYMWRIRFNPATQLYQLQNVGTGKFLVSYYGFKAGQKPSELQMMRSRIDCNIPNSFGSSSTYTGRGYWIGSPVSSGIDAIIPDTNGATKWERVALSNNSGTQRWLILSPQDLGITLLPGDVNLDGKVTVADLTALVHALRSGVTALDGLITTDLNNDGITDKADIQALRQQLLQKK